MEIPKEDGTVEKVTGANNMYKAVDAINTPMEGVTPATEDTYYRISTELMDRIETVINYGLNDGMYIIFNIHWDLTLWTTSPPQRSQTPPTTSSFASTHLQEVHQLTFISLL